MRFAPAATRVSCHIAIVIAVVLMPPPALARQAAISAEMQERSRALVQRLTEGVPVNVVVYGDSITDGWGTDGSQVYHRLFVEALRYRFPQARIDCIVSGNPGWTTDDAIGSWNLRMGGLTPDLLILQFGGNDRGWGRPLHSFRQDYARLLARATSQTNALVIACLPPWAEEIEDGPWAFTAREVAAEAGVPAADWHRAIRESPHDFRGSFPYGSHPGSYTHVVMAKELLRVFDACIGAPQAIGCELVRGEAPLDDTGYEVSATIRGLTDETLAWEARLGFGAETRDLQGTVEPDEPVSVAERFELPESLPADRSYSTPVRICARTGETGCFDVAWLTIAPALSAQPRPEAIWHTLSARSLVLGAHLWQGEDDLSARFRTVLTDDALQIDVEVRDEQITVADLLNPSRGDCVEIYFDLRSPGEQGRPFYSEDVLALQIIPPTEPGAEAKWRAMQELPADLTGLHVNGRLNVAGYRVSLELPLSAIEARRGEDWGGVGLDVGVNDADDGWRKTQMMWAGTADNYLTPACFAGVYPGPLPEGATRRVLQ